MRPLTVREVEHISFELARQHMEWDEPIPDFGTRHSGVLESCLANAFQTFRKKDLYPGLDQKAAMMFYQLIKNHPFINGNKRIALTSLLTFLYLNDRWLAATNDQLYQLAVWVAESPPEAKDGAVLAIRDFVAKNRVAHRVSG